MVLEKTIVQYDQRMNNLLFSINKQILQRQDQVSQKSSTQIPNSIATSNYDKLSEWRDPQSQYTSHQH